MCFIFTESSFKNKNGLSMQIALAVFKADPSDILLVMAQGAAKN